ncbi:MAG: DUF2938 domain-containing protein [Burkholderiales bacterium]
MTTAFDIAHVALIGAGATALMDLGLAAQKRMGVKTLDFALVGRWIGNMARGEFVHEAITGARAVPGERALGWIAHYAVGIAFAGLLVALTGPEWLRNPGPVPALALGISTVAAPLFVVQPAMGAGFAARRTPSPVKSCMRSLFNHIVFGAGLYAAAAVIDAILRLFQAR